MNELPDMIWMERLKAIRSRVPLMTALGTIFMPLGIAFLIFVSRNPGVSQQLGLISAKADLLAYSATDWSTYLEMFSQLVAAAGFVFFVLIVSWVFGREFADGTLKDLLAVPVPRGTILVAKFTIAAGWSAVVTVTILVLCLATGALIGLPGGSAAVVLQGAWHVVLTAVLVMAVALPFALAASIGRGYLLPMGAAILILMLTNLVVIAGWGEYFPFAVPGLYAQGSATMAPISYGIVLVTFLGGTAATYLWWKTADQSR